MRMVFTVIAKDLQAAHLVEQTLKELKKEIGSGLIVRSEIEKEKEKPATQGKSTKLVKASDTTNKAGKKRVSSSSKRKKVVEETTTNLASKRSKKDS